MKIEISYRDLDVILDALKQAATKYDNDRLKAFKAGNTELYLELGIKKGMAWKVYSDIKRAAGVE